MKSKSLGPIRIHRVAEIERMSVAADRFFVGSSDDAIARAIAATDRRFVDADSKSIVIGFHSFVIESDGARILVDACHGNDKRRGGVLEYADRMRTNYLSNLAEFGFQPDDIDFVLCTHLHYDHVGWNTRLDSGAWVPTFPNARYLMTRVDFEHFGQVVEDSPEGHHSAAYLDSVLPVVEAGQAELLGIDELDEVRISDGLRLEKAPGHTPGSIVLRIDGGGGRAVVSGDVVHHPLQVVEPSLHVDGESDTALATRTRRRLLEACADDGALLLPAHFPAPTAGRIARTGGGFRFACDDA